MLKTKQDSPRSESRFAPEIKFAAKKKRHLQPYKVWSIVDFVARRGINDKGDTRTAQQEIADLFPPRKRTGPAPRPIRNLSEALTVTFKTLYLRAQAAKTEEEKQQYREWARARVRWEFKVGIRKLPPKKSAAA